LAGNSKSLRRNWYNGAQWTPTQKPPSLPLRQKTICNLELINTHKTTTPNGWREIPRAYVGTCTTVRNGHPHKNLPLSLCAKKQFISTRQLSRLTTKNDAFPPSLPLIIILSPHPPSPLRSPHLPSPLHSPPCLRLRGCLVASRPAALSCARHQTPLPFTPPFPL
jgi:hypothetical protein